MKKTLFTILTIVFVIGVTVFVVSMGDKSPDLASAHENESMKNYDAKKILYIDSYHEGYAWSDGITKGIQTTLSNAGVDLKIHRLDTIRNTEDEFKENAALEAKAIIEEFQPDVLITSDDNAFKYLVMPYYRDADLPVVFCGINWDASVYEAPYSNTTGMVEISLTEKLIENLKEYSKGNKVGYLSADVLTERKNAENYEKVSNIEFTKVYFAKTFADWKEQFSRLQEEVDMIIFENNAGIKDWDEVEAEAFVLENIKIPVGTTNAWVMPTSLIGLTKIAEEQGEWSAEAALKILHGESTTDIPLVTNKKGKMIINLQIAEKLDIIFLPSILRNAEIIQ